MPHFSWHLCQRDAILLPLLHLSSNSILLHNFCNFSPFRKGFKCSGVEGQDVVKLLKKSIGKRGDIRVDVSAILNDTTGCLMSCAWKNPKCRIGLIIGTGTNACYLEDMDNVSTY